MDNASDRKSIRAKEKAAKLVDSARREVIKNLMSTTFGREWMWDRLERCHIFAQTFISDPLATAFAEGQRSIGLADLADIMLICPDQYIQAARESNERHLSNDRSTSSEQFGSEDAERRDQGRTDSDFDPYGSASDGHEVYNDGVR